MDLPIIKDQLKSIKVHVKPKFLNAYFTITMNYNTFQSFQKIITVHSNFCNMHFLSVDFSHSLYLVQHIYIYTLY